MFHIKIAEVIVEINNKYEEVYNRCKEYAVSVNSQPDICITATNDEINAGKKWFLAYENRIVSDSYAEFSQIHHNIYAQLPFFDAFWMHAVAVSMQGSCYAFTAPGGYGKSTHGKLWVERWPQQAQIINGDNPIIRRQNGSFFAYGTPFCGKEGYNVNIGRPLRGLCYLQHGTHNSIRKMDRSIAYSQLLRDSFAYVTDKNAEHLMTLLEEFVATVSVYQLTCNQEIEAAEVAYEGMRNG